MKLMQAYFKKNLGLTILFVALSVASWGLLSGTYVFTQLLVDLMMDGDMGRFMAMLRNATLFVALSATVFFIASVTNERFQVAIKKNMRKDLYQGIMRRSRRDYESTDTAEYISAMSNDINTFGTRISTLYMFIAGVSGMTSSLVIMLFYNLLLTAVALACSALAVMLPVIFSRLMQKRQAKLTESQADFTVNMKEIFAGHEVIASFSLFGLFAKRFIRENNALAHAEYGFGKLQAATSATGQMISYGTRFIMVLVAGVLVMNNTVTIGAFMLFVALQGTFSSMAVMLTQIMPYLSSLKPVAEKLGGYLNYADDSAAGDAEPTLDIAVEAKGLSFRYNEDMPILKNLPLHICKNEKIALTGASGCGKTTLVKLLSGDYTGYEGDILYDGVEISKLDNGRLRRLITVIHQNTYIFNDTVRYNICLDEEFTQSKLNAALKQSGVDKFIHMIPGGPEGQCGEKGVNLSGGQRQRIAIARALIRGAKFLVLDEGVSAIDIETANEIEQELLNIRELTLLTVTHRIKDGLLDKYDSVLHMRDGKIEG